MIKKVFAVLSIVFIIALSFFAGAKVASASDGPDLPDQPGTYDVPGNPKLKLRVFVHNPKQKNNVYPQCSDPGSTAVDGVTGWHLSGNVTYRLNTSSAPAGVGPANLVTLASDAFSTWSQAVSGKITFSQGPDTFSTKASNDGQNIVAWGRTPGTALAVTYTWYYPATGQVVNTDTIFNKKFAWSWIPFASGACGLENTYDAQDILTHELGHWMGLNDEYTSDFVNNTMYGYGATAEIKKDTLTSGDISGVSSIYK